MTEQTAATETTPVLTEDLPGPDPDLSLSAGAGTESGPGSPQLPGPVPDEGQPAGNEPAAGPGSFAFHQLSECPGERGCPIHGETMPGMSTGLADAAPADESDCKACGAPTREGDRFNAGYGFLCADIAACIARLSAGTQAASEPAADLEALCARLAGPQQPAPEVPRWDSLWAAFSALERDNAIGDQKDGDLLNAWEQQARAVVFPARRALVTA
jgi:hypothetical protein